LNVRSELREMVEGFDALIVLGGGGRAHFSASPRARADTGRQAP
jgi:hypothetical protein